MCSQLDVSIRCGRKNSCGVIDNINVPEASHFRGMRKPEKNAITYMNEVPNWIDGLGEGEHSLFIDTAGRSLNSTKPGVGGEALQLFFLDVGVGVSDSLWDIVIEYKAEHL